MSFAQCLSLSLLSLPSVSHGPAVFIHIPPSTPLSSPFPPLLHIFLYFSLLHLPHLTSLPIHLSSHVPHHLNIFVSFSLLHFPIPCFNFSCYLLMLALTIPSSSCSSPAAFGTDGRPACWKGPDRRGGGQAAGPESCRGWDRDAAYQSDRYPWPGRAAAHGAEDAGGRNVGPQDGWGIRKEVGRGERRPAWMNNNSSY